MPGALDGYSSSIVYKLTSLRYIFCIRYDYLQDQNWVGHVFRELLFCTQYAFFHAFLRFVQNVWKAKAGMFFLVYSACMNFLGHFVAPPPCPITFLKVRPCLFLNQVNKIVYSLLVELFRSLMYFNNTNGPRMEPCGTPQVTFFLLTFSYIYQFVFYWKGNFLFKHEICHENHRNKVNGYYDLPCQMLLVNQALTWQWIYVQWFLLSYQQVQLSHD